MKRLAAMVPFMLACVALGATRAGDDMAHEAHKHEVIAPGAPIPGESLYQLKIDLTTQDGKRTSLAALRGTPTLVTMFYASCDGVCPMIAFTLRRLEAALTAARRARLRVLMVSFDPERDTPAALAEFAATNKIADARWLLARAPENKVRELAAVLGIRYRKLSGGAFSHSTVIALLDEDGVIRAHTSTLSQLDADFMKALDRELSAAPVPR